MSYTPSRSARNYLRRFESRGKAKSLVRPEHKPPLQYVFDGICLIALPVVGYLYYAHGWQAALALLGGVIVLWTIRELFVQDDHALVRIYGPAGRLRFVFEKVFRDKYLQYFNETNTDGRPIPRIVRDYVYQKAHDVKSVASFGTELDNFDRDNTIGARILHRNFGGVLPNGSPTYGFEIGAARGDVRPFAVKNSLNISAMSYGSINYKSAEAIGLGTREVGYVNTGEGGFGPHGVGGGDVVFQIGTGKFGVGDKDTLPDGTPTRVLNRQLLKDLVQQHDAIRMIQIKLSQGAKPGLGGHLPGGKVTEAVATVRKVPVGQTVISPPMHAEIMAATPKESIQKMIDFVEEIRTLTGLPVGIKLCVGRVEELDLLVEAMKSTGKGPDAIQLDGTDGGTGAGHNLFLNYVGYGTAIETTAYLDHRLKEAGIRDRVALSASGKILTPAHAALAFAAGADSIDTARGAMLALGCIQSLKCHTNECPTGIATNSPWRSHGINIPEKATRIHHYLSGFHKDVLEITRVLGHSDPRDITPPDLRYLGESYFEDDPGGVKIPAWRG
ncbi:MAG: FMN-binding glutamate synthase family protein [bacterium]|nr:FMN-binding glutamate synthase family protein [bacterium]